MKILEKSGSVLLLSTLIVSALFSSVIYISALSLRQISQAVNTDNAFIAFYTAESSNEQAVYYIRNKLYENIEDLNLDEKIFTDSNSSVSRELSDEVYGIFTGIKKDKFFQADMFDVDDVNYISNISYLELNWNDTCSGDSWLELTANEWSSGDSINWFLGINQSHVQKTLLNNASYLKSDNTQIENIGGSTLQTSKLYQFRLKALYCDIYNLRFAAYDSLGNMLPFKNIFNIKSVGEYPAGSTKANRQALSTNLRKFSPLSGLFDYVLFSEKSLIKDIGAYSGGWFSEDFYISTVNLSPAIQNREYIFHLSAVNGTQPYVWELVSGNLPEGIELTREGVLLGRTSSDPGTFFFVVKVVDGDRNSVEKNLQLILRDE